MAQGDVSSRESDPIVAPASTRESGQGSGKHSTFLIDPIDPSFGGGVLTYTSSNTVLSGIVLASARRARCPQTWRLGRPEMSDKAMRGRGGRVIAKIMYLTCPSTAAHCHQYSDHCTAGICEMS